MTKAKGTLQPSHNLDSAANFTVVAPAAVTNEVSCNQENNINMSSFGEGKVEIAMRLDAVEAEEEEPKAPYYYYRDHSHLQDPDPTKPVTIPGRIPTFPAKLFAILSRQDLSDIVSWMPHGRSWKVHKPREFEVKVIPQYFDHNKFSSFIRQANGWGFKRVCTKGADRNSHYHELFLRGMPHLIKFMKRPLSGSKVSAQQPQHSKGRNCDPDFYKISEELPLPEFTPKMMHPLDESSFLNPDKQSESNSVLGSQASNCGRPSTPSSTGDMVSVSQFQAFLAQSEELKKPAAPTSQPFLLPRVPDQQQQVPKPVSSHEQTIRPTQSSAAYCPVRQEEKDLDPLTILLNDVYDEHPTIEDPIIESLMSVPSVPPPSSLDSYMNPPVSPTYSSMEYKPVLSHQTMYYESTPQAQLVSPVEEKQIMELPEPAPFFQSYQPLDKYATFHDTFTGGLVAQDFW